MGNVYTCGSGAGLGVEFPHTDDSQEPSPSLPHFTKLQCLESFFISKIASGDKHCAALTGKPFTCASASFSLHTLKVITVDAAFLLKDKGDLFVWGSNSNGQVHNFAFCYPSFWQSINLDSILTISS